MELEEDMVLNNVTKFHNILIFLIYLTLRADIIGCDVQTDVRM